MAVEGIRNRVRSVSFRMQNAHPTPDTARMIPMAAVVALAALALLMIPVFAGNAHAGRPADSQTDADTPGGDSLRVRPQDSLSDADVAALLRTARTYTLVLLSIGPRRNAYDSATSAAYQRAHLRYLYTLHRQGKILVLGPIAPGDSLRGICIYASSDTAEVRRLVQADPGVACGRDAYRIFPWYGLPGDCVRE